MQKSAGPLPIYRHPLVPEPYPCFRTNTERARPAKSASVAGSTGSGRAVVPESRLLGGRFHPPIDRGAPDEVEIGRLSRPGGLIFEGTSRGLGEILSGLK